MTKRSQAAASLMITAVLAGCGKAKTSTPEPPETAARPPAVIELTAIDYAFQSPDTIPGGWVTLRLSNGGKELHHAALYRLDGGKSDRHGAGHGDRRPQRGSSERVPEPSHTRARAASVT